MPHGEHRLTILKIADRLRDDDIALGWISRPD
jgi:hypothetical protein